MEHAMASYLEVIMDTIDIWERGVSKRNNMMMRIMNEALTRKDDKDAK
jgi:DNA-binding transcriptional regulator YiaG